MDEYAGIVGLIDRRERGSPIHAREPTGIAMGEHTQRSIFANRKRFDQLPTVPADSFTGCNIFVGHTVPAGGWCKVWAAKPA